MKENSARQQKINTLMLRDLSEIFNNIGYQIQPGIMFTVTTVRVSSDLSIAKVYLSMFPVSDKEAVLKKVKEASPKIRYEFGLRVKNQLRIIPEFRFYIDDSLDYIDKIDNLLKQ